MTTTAAAPAFGPMPPSAPRAQPQAAIDRFGFATVLDSLPGSEAKASSSVDGDQSAASNEPRQGEAPPGQPDFQSILSSLPLAFLPASAPRESAAAAAEAPLLAPASTLGLRPEDDGASNVADADAPNAAPVGRLVGERAFHLPLQTVGPTAPLSQGGGARPPFLVPISTQGQGLIGEGAPSLVGAASAIASVGASRTGEDLLLASLSSPRSATSPPIADAAPSSSETSGSAPIAPRVNGSSANPSAAVTRAQAQSSPHGGRKSEVAALTVARTASSAAPAPTEPSGKTADGPPDRAPSGVQSAPTGSAFGAAPSASLAQGPSFGSYDAPSGAADVAPRASALSAARTAAAPPVKEIDVDLSPSGLEDASMTMRLAGGKLSVVIRAASSQTYGSIEGARDAIADRLAAIGQPLNSLIIQQVGGNADANTNGNAASRDDGSTTGDRPSRQGAGGQGHSNDPSASRRGASGDLSF